MIPQRCAIYTRKSTEDGLEQEFNSLDAQREACAAYILSQRHEGWRELPTAYDDGGISGGTMDRPDLKRLLSDIEAGLIDVVVVYKVDRLTRSLSDFAKIVETFDAHDVSFVSVTQAFNTTSSMGRLTLNVLLSFAQFEREVTAERIRDKVAASKKKGMWMGGAVPLGYVVREKALHIEEGEAALVRMIYDRYQALGSVNTLRAELDAQGMAIPRHPSPTPQPFTRSGLHWILRNPTYCGETRHKDKTYPGRHEAIIERSQWQVVQAHLDEHGGGSRAAERRKAARMLDGMLHDADGTLLRTSYALRSVKTKEGPVKKRYWYYQRRAKPNADTQGTASLPATRLPADGIERVVLDTLATHLADRAWVGEAVLGQGHCAEALAGMLANAKDMAARLREGDDLISGEALKSVLHKAQLHPRSLTLVLNPDWLTCDRDNPSILPDITIPLHLRQVGRNKPIVITTGAGKTNRDADLIAMIADARRWATALQSGTAHSVDALTKSEGRARGVISKMLPLAFLAPDITDAILAGNQPLSLTATCLRRITSIPADWHQQRILLGFKAG